MKLSSKKVVRAVAFAVLLLLLFADEYPALRFRGDGRFSGGPVFGYWIRLGPIPFHRTGEYVFHLRGMPNEEMSLQLYAEGKTGDSRSELTNLNTQLEALLLDQNRRTLCRAPAVFPQQTKPCHHCTI